jgi:rod shape-determining protein MreB and related proteins
MSRFGSFLQKYVHHLDFQQKSFGLDVGSFNTRIQYHGKVIFLEPTCLAVHTANREVIAVGKMAADLQGKTPASVEVIWPIRAAQVIHAEALQQFLKVSLQKTGLLTKETLPFFRNEVKVAVPSQTSEVQKDAWKKTGDGISARITNVSKIAALTNNPTRRHYTFFIDIGAMTIEMGVVTQDNIVLGKTERIGGEDITQMIINTIRRKNHMEVGYLTAEEIKKEIVRVELTENKPRKMVVHGRDVLTGLPSTFSLSSEIFQEEVAKWAKKIEEEVRRFCLATPPEILSQALAQGVFLTGGGAQLVGLAEFLSQALKTEMVISSTPLEDVVKGL